MTRDMVWALFWLAFIGIFAWKEHADHAACWQSGGTVVTGVFQDGCEFSK